MNSPIVIRMTLLLRSANPAGRGLGENSRPTRSSRLGRAAAADRRRNFFRGGDNVIF